MRDAFVEAMACVKVGLVLGDRGFGTDEILRTLEVRSLNHVIAARAYANLKKEIFGMNDWVEICSCFAVKEQLRQPADPVAKARRNIVVGKPISRRSQAGGKLLFKDLADYRFRLQLTTLDLPFDQIWNIYNRRADCDPSAARQTASKAARRTSRSQSENLIKQLMQDFGLDAFCLQDFWAPEASFLFIIVAYHLRSLFWHFELSSRNQATLVTLRFYCFEIGGWISQHAGKRVLKLSLHRKKCQ